VRTLLARFALTIAFAVAAAAPSALRAQASAYVPLDDVAYSYVDALMARGALKDLSALERPYTRRELLAAIDSTRPSLSGERMLSWLDALERTIGKYEVAADSDSAALHTRFSGDLYATAQSSGRRELMLADDRNSVEPGMTIRMVMEGGPVAASIRGLIDNRLNQDPEFAGRKDRKIAGRTEDGYGSAQWKYGEVFVGRLGRNWGPSALTGLQLGNYAYTYDHLYGRIGTRAFHISTVLARLDDDKLQSGATVQRYFSIHRLAMHRGAWDAAASESFVYTGVGRGFEPSLSNPFNLYSLSWRNERADGNLALGLETSWRSARLGILSAQLLLDDVQIDKCDTICNEPSSYGLTVSAEGLPLRGDHRAFVSYTRVSNLTYRTPNYSERYAIFNVGLGRGFSDYDELRGGVDLALSRYAPVKIYVAFRRQGEGDYRTQFPLVSAYPTTPVTFSGTVMNVARVGVSSGGRFRSFEFSGDAGFNHASNFAHMAGVTQSAFEGRVKLSWIPSAHLDF